MQFFASIGEFISTVMNMFGTSFVVPLIMFIISIIMGAEVKKAAKGSIYMAAGLAMFSAILGVLLSGIAPYVVGMAQNSGISLPYVDVGWQGASVIVYSNQLGYLYLVFGLGLNLILFALKFTNTFQPTDIWNFYQFVFWAIIVQFVTGSLVLAILAAMFMNLIVLLIADIIAPSIQEYYGYEGVTLTSVPQAVAPWAILVRWVLMKLKVKEYSLDTKGLTDRFGFWGEPLTIGLVVGLLITILGSVKGLGSGSTWGGILSVTFMVAGVMVIYPTISGLFVKGLIPLSQSFNKRIRSGKSGRKQFNVAMDPAVYFGESSNLTAALIMIPLVFFISVVMPGNRILMLADIPAMPFMTVGLIFVFRGNILYTVIAGTVWYSFCNVINSDVCIAFTDAATKAGIVSQLPAVADAFSKGLGVASWTVGSNPILWLAYKAFSADGNWKILTIAIALAVYAAVYILFRKHQRKFYLAAGASESFLDEHYADVR